MNFRKSGYFNERKYLDTPELELDEDVIKYWKKVIGKQEYEDILSAYGLNEINLLFSDEYVENIEFKSDIDEIESLFFEGKGKDIEINILQKDNEQLGTLVFESFFISVLRTSVYFFRRKIGLYPAFESSFANVLLERLSKISLRILTFEMQLNKKEGKLSGSNSREEYLCYNNFFLSDIKYIASLFDVYPCWERLLFESVFYITENYRKVIERIDQDHSDIVKIFCKGLDFSEVVNVQNNISDSHKRADTVLIIQLDNGIKIVYKPRNLRAEIAYSSFLNQISSDCKHKMKELQIINKNNYGWEEFVQAKPCTSSDDLKKYYYRFGILIFANYILNANDLHVENVIAMGEYPIVIDAETILDNKRSEINKDARDLIYDIIYESVLFSGLLPYYRFSGKGKGIDMSAIRGKEGEEYPILLPQVKNAGTSDMYFEYVHPVTEVNNNLARLREEFVNPDKFTEDICDGFKDAYLSTMKSSKKLSEWIDMFSNLKVRHLVQDTMRYSMLLHTSYHPYFMQDGRDRQLFFGSMFKNYKKIQGNEDIVKLEIEDMLHMDIPYFYLNTSKSSLYAWNGTEVKGYFENTSMEHFKNKIEHMNESSMNEQIRFIRIALTDLNKCEKEMAIRNYSVLLNRQQNGDSYGVQAIDKITELLMKSAIYGHDKKDVNWLGVTLIGDKGKSSWDICPLNNYLYEGISGLAIYFRAIEKTFDNVKYKRICEAIEENLYTYTDEMCERSDEYEKENCGVFNGESGLIYTYQLLYKLTEDKKYINYAEKHTQIIKPIIMRDRGYDIIYGSAGALIVLINMYELTHKQEYLELAINAGNNLLKGQIKSKEDYGGWIGAGSKQPLTGFSHGVAGIVWALAKLWDVTKDRNILDSIRSGIKFENGFFNKEYGNWLDRRQRTEEEYKKFGSFMTAWCHGATGILLGRAKMYQVLPEEFREIIIKDMENALRTVMKTGYNSNDCLCHGNLGNTEIILEYCKVFDNHEVKRNCQSLRNQIAKEICKPDYECGRSYLHGYKIPGFMTGISGMGYSLLRDINDSLPCVLSVDI